MKKQKLIPSLLMMGLMMVVSPSTFSVSASSGYGGGSGTQNDPYLISTPEHLNQLQLDVNVNGVNTKGKYYQLTTDIDLSNYDNDSDETNGNFTPIGNSSSISFKGIFDGNGHVISNLKIILQNKDNVGLFGYTTYATIQKIGLENVVIKGYGTVGALVGRHTDGMIIQSYITGDVSGGSDNSGGLVGAQFNGTITQCYALTNVSGRNIAGGLVGYQNGGVISRNYAKGTVKVQYNYVGGLVGRQLYGEINENYTDVVLSGSGRGGIVGNRSANASVLNSYYNADTTNQENDGGGVGLSSRQMSKRRAKENMDGFDFDTIWQLSNDKPLFNWQPPVPITEEEVIINGSVESTVLSLTIPSDSMSFILNPNEEVDKQFIASDFELINGSTTPLTLEIKSFEQVTDILSDVKPIKYGDWSGLNKTQSKDIALALVPKVGEGWLSLNEGNRWVANLGEPVVGTIKGNSTVSFGFEAKHGASFTETLTPQYKLTFVFGLQD